MVEGRLIVGIPLRRLLQRMIPGETRTRSCPMSGRVLREREAAHLKQPAKSVLPSLAESRATTCKSWNQQLRSRQTVAWLSGTSQTYKMHGRPGLQWELYVSTWRLQCPMYFLFRFVMVSLLHRHSSPSQAAQSGQDARTSGGRVQTSRTKRKPDFTPVTAWMFLGLGPKGSM